MSQELMKYRATLNRGWEIVQLEYVLEEDAVAQRRKRSWGGMQEQRVELGALSGEVRRVWGRQPAYIWSTAVLVVALLVLGLDATVHGVGAGGAAIDWRLWGPLLGVAGGAWVVRLKTKRPAEWSHFVGVGKGKGLFVLKDRRDGGGHGKFVDAVKRRLAVS